MATRRQKLRNIFALAVEQGVTTEDLLARIEQFTASGKSGIEPFINETLADLQSVNAPTVDVNEVRTYLTKALAALDQA